MDRQQLASGDADAVGGPQEPYVSRLHGDTPPSGEPEPPDPPVIEGAVRLNRFGLERGRMWPAVLLVLAVFAPAVLWTEWNRSVDGEEPVPAGTVLRLTSSQFPQGTVTITVPGEGWSTELGGNSTDSVTLQYEPLVVDVSAVSDVKSIDVLYERRAGDLRSAGRPLLATGSRPYTSPAGLTGLWADLTGERYSGALIVIGRDKAAAVIIVLAPLGRLSDNQVVVDHLLTGLEVDGDA